MLTIIKNADLHDIRRELSRLMREGSQRMDVREFALSIAPDYNNDQISAIYEYAKRNIQYIRDPDSTELFIASWKMIELIEQGKAAGDCDDMALFCASLLRSIGYETRIVLLDTTGQGIDHAICEVYSEKIGLWISVDVASEHPLGWITKSFSRMEIE